MTVKIIANSPLSLSIQSLIYLIPLCYKNQNLLH